MVADEYPARACFRCGGIGPCSRGVGAGWSARVDALLAWTRSLNMREPLNEADNAVGKQLPYVPVWSGAVTVRLQWRSWTVDYKWNYYSERFTTTDNSAMITAVSSPIS